MLSSWFRSCPCRVLSERGVERPTPCHLGRRLTAVVQSHAGAAFACFLGGGPACPEVDLRFGAIPCNAVGTNTIWKFRRDYM